MTMTKQGRVEYYLARLEEILKKLEELKNRPIDHAELENLKMRIQIYAALLNFYSR